MEWLLAWCKENEAVFAGPNSYSLQCMTEGSDMHVNIPISLCSSFSRLPTNLEFYVRLSSTTMTGTNVHVHTVWYTSKSVWDQSLIYVSRLVVIFLSTNLSERATAIFHEERLNIMHSFRGNMFFHGTGERPYKQLRQSEWQICVF